MNPTTQPSEGAVRAANEYPLTRTQRLVINDAATVLGEMNRRCPGSGIEVHVSNCMFMLEKRVASPSTLRQSARSLRVHRSSLGVNGDQEAMALDLLADELEATDPCQLITTDAPALLQSLRDTIRSLESLCSEVFDHRTPLSGLIDPRNASTIRSAYHVLCRHTSTQGKEGKL